jgi:serine/threonine protein kinase
MESSAAARVLGGKYRLIRQLEQGGMGSVWYAEHLVLNSPVAVKLLHLEDRESAPLVQRFLREAQTAASLRSPHVVQILDYGVDEQTPFIVMELLVGESLARRLRRVGRLTPGETDVVITQVARAIGRAHDAGVIHRDLKPGNVFVVRDAELELIKVLDFGIAKAPASVGDNTQSGTFLGTPAYASPEQVHGARSLDYRTDLWSLGVITFECLLGARPFAGDTFGAIVLSVCSKPMPVPSSCGVVPAGFDEWFAKACARDPAERFASARQAADALALICARGPTHDEKSGTHGLAAGPGPLVVGQAPTVPDGEGASKVSGSAVRALSRDTHTSIAARTSPRRWLFLAAGVVLVSVVFLLRAALGPLESPPMAEPAPAASPSGVRAAEPAAAAPRGHADTPARAPTPSANTERGSAATVDVPDPGLRASAWTAAETQAEPAPKPPAVPPPASGQRAKARSKAKAKSASAASTAPAPAVPTDHTVPTGHAVPTSPAVQAGESEFDLGL